MFTDNHSSTHAPSQGKNSDARAAHARAMVFHGVRKVDVQRVPVIQSDAEEVLVEVEYSGVSSGTERLLWDGSMPPFPGLGYPLVPGYESVGAVLHAPKEKQWLVGRRVFVPGAKCFGEIKGLFGASASLLSVPAHRLVVLPPGFELMAPNAEPVLIALAATALHMVRKSRAKAGLTSIAIFGHGVLGRLLARVLLAEGHRLEVVFETNPKRREGVAEYQVLDPLEHSQSGFDLIFDVTGDAGILDQLVGRLSMGGEIVLGGFYPDRLQFGFAMAFMKEVNFQIASQWQPEDLESVVDLVLKGRLSLGALITHQTSPSNAAEGYRMAFENPDCLKMVFRWEAEQ